MGVWMMSLFMKSIILISFLQLQTSASVFAQNQNPVPLRETKNLKYGMSALSLISPPLLWFYVS